MLAKNTGMPLSILIGLIRSHFFSVDLHLY